MKVYDAKFIMGAAGREQFPEESLPEVAFAGRSNVGKSSLINSIVMRKNLARTSSTPGKTREVNFFNVEDKWMLVDMPGFGYAAVGKDYRIKWAKLNYAYLECRKNLKLVCALIDSRHDPMDNDMALVEWLEHHQQNYIIILTKCDKNSKKSNADRLDQVRYLVSQCGFCIDVLMYSVINGTGRKELQAIIKRYCEEKGIDQ